MDMCLDSSQEKFDDFKEERQETMAGRAMGSFAFVFKHRGELSIFEDRSEEITKPMEKKLTETCWCRMD